MLKPESASQIPLPRAWNRHVRSALLHVIALAQYSTAYTRGWAANSINARVRLKAENERLRQEVALLQEELRIKDAQFSRTPPLHRSHYRPTERMCILELRAARGWSLKQVAGVFLITAATIATWNKRSLNAGDTSIANHEPVNKFPDFVRHVVQQLKVFCPQLGKVKIAQFLARAGLQLSASTVGRILKEQPVPQPANVVLIENRHGVQAKHANHVWHVDLTAVPISSGLWAPWLPFALPQCWPFCWWVGIVLDQYSRRVMGTAIFPNKPSSQAVRAFLGRIIRNTGSAPKPLICDKCSQFWCGGFKAWAERRQIRLRFGAVNRHGSLAVIERFIGTLKREGARRVRIPVRRASFCRELHLMIRWYHEFRPHMALEGRTPEDIYLRSKQSCPRLGNREPWSSRSEKTSTRSAEWTPLQLVVTHLAGRRHLPIVSLRRAA